MHWNSPTYSLFTIFLFKAVICYVSGQSPPPTPQPTRQPMLRRTDDPTRQPKPVRTQNPSPRPTVTPSEFPTKQRPSERLTRRPSRRPTQTPSRRAATRPPTQTPTQQNSNAPTDSPSNPPSDSPSDAPSGVPSEVPPSDAPSDVPSEVPSDSPSLSRSFFPSAVPSILTTAPTTAPSRGSSPRPSDVCVSQASVLRSCYIRTGDYARCDSCVADSIPDPPSTCLELQTNTCTAIVECCENCHAELELFLNCYMDNRFQCPILCPFPPEPRSNVPTSVSAVPPTAMPTRPCGDDETALRLCYYGMTLPWTDCDSCVANRLPSSTNCSNLQAVVCDSIQTCPCSECAAPLEGYLNCSMEANVQCTIDCGG